MDLGSSGVTCASSSLAFRTKVWLQAVSASFSRIHAFLFNIFQWKFHDCYNFACRMFQKTIFVVTFQLRLGKVNMVG